MKKNIVIVVSAMNMGGAQRAVATLCNTWSDIGHSVTLIYTYSGDKVSYYQLNNKVNHEFLNTSGKSIINRFFPLFWKLLSLRAVVKRKNPDVIFSFLTRVNVATALSTMGLEFPVVLCERTWPPFKNLEGYFFWVYRTTNNFKNILHNRPSPML